MNKNPNEFPDAELLAGVATAGIAWGAMAADQLKLPYIYVRPKPKEHGLGNQIEGYFEKGQQTVVIEDLVSTGKMQPNEICICCRTNTQVDDLKKFLNFGKRKRSWNVVNSSRLTEF